MNEAVDAKMIPDWVKEQRARFEELQKELLEAFVDEIAVMDPDDKIVSEAIERMKELYPELSTMVFDTVTCPFEYRGFKFMVSAHKMVEVVHDPQEDKDILGVKTWLEVTDDFDEKEAQKVGIALELAKDECFEDFLSFNFLMQGASGMPIVSQLNLVATEVRDQIDHYLVNIEPFSKEVVEKYYTALYKQVYVPLPGDTDAKEA